MCLNTSVPRFGGGSWDGMGQSGVLNIILSNNLLSYISLIIDNNTRSENG